MPGDEVGLAHQVDRADWFRPKAQVRDGDRARLLRVIDEVALRVIFRAFADDLDGIFVRAHRAVRAQTVKHRANHIVGFGREFRVHRQAGVGNVVGNADGEMIFRLLLLEIVEHRLDHRGREFLRRQTIPSADNLRHRLQLAEAVHQSFRQRGDGVLIKWFARRARFLGSVQNRDGLHASRQRLDELARVKRPIQPHFQHADFLALFEEVIHRFMRRLATGTHQHDHALGVRRSDVVEQLVGAAHHLRKLIHGVLHDLRAGGVKIVARLATLEERVGILRRAAQHRPVRRHRPGAQSGNHLVVNQRAQIRVR